MQKTFTKKVKDEIAKQKGFDRNAVRKSLREKFIKHGTIYDPKLAHHLEYNFKDHAKANATIKELTTFDIQGRLSINNQDRYIVYIVDASTIIKFLKVLGATKAHDEYMKITEYKSKAKDTNRKVNFEVANIKKTSVAALSQLEDIENLLKIRKLKTLPESIQSLIKARKKYDTLSLSELAKVMGVSKSALNHRFIKIRKMLKEHK